MKKLLLLLLLVSCQKENQYPDNTTFANDAENDSTGTVFFQLQDHGALINAAYGDGVEITIDTKFTGRLTIIGTSAECGSPITAIKNGGTHTYEARVVNGENWSWHGQFQVTPKQCTKIELCH